MTVPASSSVPANRKSGYIPTLDGWRAVAIGMVLLTHMPNPPAGPIMTRAVAAGAMGVDLFFAISGILICSRLLEEERVCGSISLRGFYLRRAFRIFPAAYFYLAVIAVLTLLRFVPHDWPAWASAVFFFRNYFSVFVRESFPGRLTGHFWSLAIEEHFYFLLPAILVCFPRHRKLALGGLTIAAFTWLCIYLLTTPMLARQIVWQRRSDLRLQSLLFPAFLALLLAVPRWKRRFERFVTPRNIAVILVVLFLAGIAKHFSHAPGPAPIAIADPANPGNFLAHKEGPVEPFPVFVAPIFFPFLILSTMLHPGAWLSRFLELKPLRAVGRISYSLYLWQQLFWVPVSYGRWPIHFLQRPMLGFALTFGFAIASYFLLEKPAIRLGHRLFPPPTPGHANLRESPPAPSTPAPPRPRPEPETISDPKFSTEHRTLLQAGPAPAENRYLSADIPSSTKMSKPLPRLHELDALRGLAALTVMLTHFHDLWFDDRFTHLSHTRWTHLNTLLLPLYAGHQAVMLFFLLSGFVLALPFENGKPQRYPVFFIRRVTRIYLPYLAAIFLAIAGCCLWHGDLHHGPWLAFTWQHRPSLSLVLQHIAFIGVYDTRLLNPPIWSLIYEMRISLVFPLLWLATRRLRSGGSLLLALALSLVSAILLRGDPGLARISLALTLRYSGFFVIGILLARHHRKMLPRPGTQTIALTCIAAPIFYYGALFTEKLAGPHLSGANQLLIAEWVTLFGAIGIVLAGLSARRLLHGGFPLFAGRISYSLYLVHFPVLLAVTSIAGTLSAWLQFPIYVFSTLAIATVFCLFIEEPCMRWGRSITTRKAPPPGGALERETGIEPATFSLGS